MNKNFCVYMHTFPNNKKYIGITSTTPERRWQNGTGYDSKHQPVIYNAIQKYGWENVSHDILFENLTIEEAQNIEKELIAKYKTNCRKYGDDYGYNMTDGGEGTLGHIAGENVRISNQKRMTGKTGKDCCNSRPVICDNIEYESLTDFMIKNNNPKGNITGWLSGKVGMPKYWYDKQLHYKDCDFSLLKCSEINNREVVVDGIVYKTLKEASDYLKIIPASLCNYLSGKTSLPLEFVKYNIHYSDEEEYSFRIRNRPLENKIEYDNQIFNSQRELARYLKVGYGTLHSWVSGKNKIPQKYKDKGLKSIK